MHPHAYMPLNVMHIPQLMDRQSTSQAHNHTDNLNNTRLMDFTGVMSQRIQPSENVFQRQPLLHHLPVHYLQFLHLHD